MEYFKRLGGSLSHLLFTPLIAIRGEIADSPIATYKMGEHKYNTNRGERIETESASRLASNRRACRPYSTAYL